MCRVVCIFLHHDNINSNMEVRRSVLYTWLGMGVLAAALTTSIVLYAVAKTQPQPPFNVTFVIPSINRPSLQRTLKSLMVQTNPSWRATVVFDGVMPDNRTPPDPRIRYVFLNKKMGDVKSDGAHGRAGRVRNYGIDARSSGPWIAFVDDDDVLHPEYVETLQQTVNGGSPDVVIFRMQYADGTVLPPPGATDFTKNNVGISFAYRKPLFDAGFQFAGNSETEDFDLLDKLRRAKRRIVMHPSVRYFVEPGQGQAPA